MNKRLIASLLTACMVFGAAAHAPVQVMAQTSSYFSADEEIAGTSIVSSAFTGNTHPSYESYEDAFKITGITSYTNNGGKYGSSVLSRAFDGNTTTHWETGKPNTTDFKNEIIVTFDEIENINRIVYAPRPGNKGHVTKMSIYASLEDFGDDFELVATGTSAIRSGLSEFKFQTSQFKRLKFVFEEANQAWAAAGELMFFREDQALDTMKGLFTNDSKYMVNEPYQNEEALIQLENLVKQHPYVQEFAADIELARYLLENPYHGQTDSKISLYRCTNAQNIEAYNEIFKVSPSLFKSVTNNGGHYGQSVLTRLYDGNNSSHWETGKANSSQFMNEVTFTFDEQQEINRILIAPRADASHKGFPLKYEIYGSLDENSSEYTLVASGSTPVVYSQEAEIRFEATQFKKLKFRFVEAYNGMAGLGEMSFYKVDEVTDKVYSVFKDALYTQLSEEFDTLEEIEALEELLREHPLKEEHMQIINSAKKVLNNELEAIQTYVLSQKGNPDKIRAEKRQIFAGANLELTGYYVMPGESIDVYVDADPSGVMPMVVFAQVGVIDNNSKQGHYKTLSVGKNTFTAPSGTKGYAIYFSNKATEEEQAYAPTVRLEGETLTRYPIYIDGVTDPEKYVQEVAAHQGENMTDIMGDRFLFSVPNSEAKLAYVGTGILPSYTAERMEKFIEISDRLSGYDLNDSNPLHRPSTALYYYKATNGSGIYASNEHIHGNASAARYVLKGEVDMWGICHEFGHQIENADMRIIEVTNNLYSTYIQKEFGRNADRVSDQATIDKFFTFEGTKHFGGFGEEVDFQLDLFARLMVIRQITNHFGMESYGEAARLIRENASRYNTGSSQAIITAFSEAVGYDLVPHFEQYNYPVTAETRTFTSQFKPLEVKTYYSSNKAEDLTAAHAETYTESTKALIKEIEKTKTGFTLELGVSDTQDSTIVYEIYRDEKLIAVHRSNTYTDTVDPEGTYSYQVVAYDHRLNESLPSEVTSSDIAYSPVIEVYDTLSFRLGDPFEPLKYINATAFDGTALDESQVEVVSHNVDTSKQGDYEVTYRATDRGVSVQKSVAVKVVSDFIYASDVDWTSAVAEYKSVMRDKSVNNMAIQLLEHGKVKEYAKGIGTHAHSEIIYDIEGMPYEYFETVIGVDRGIAAQNNSSIIFKIFTDGEEVYNSGMMTYYTSAKSVRIPLEGVSELKLVVENGGNGNASDHASFADAKFLVNNSAPKLEVSEDINIKLGETLDDIFGEYSAFDIEDGDLSDVIEVSGHVDFTRPGRYLITYTVMDSDGNIVTKERTIAVVDMNDAGYVSDYDWKTASCGWGSIKKDAAPSGNKIRLTNENNKEIIFEKGLGTHAKSTVIYDLDTIEAEFFSAYVGVDRAMYNSIGSVSFEVWLDGVKVEDTGVIRATDAMRYIEVNLQGASELKLVATDGGNGNGSDHAVWGDAKFHFANAENVPVDKSELEALIETVDRLNDEFYTEASWESLSAVKSEAEALMMQEAVTQDEIDEMLSRLTEAKEALEEMVIQSELEILVEELKALDLSRYTQESVIKVKEAIQAGETVLNQEETQEVMDKTAAELRQVLDGITLSQGKITLGEALEKAFDAELDCYEGNYLWNDFLMTRNVYRTNYESETTYEEIMLDFMADFLLDLIESVRQAGVIEREPAVQLPSAEEFAESTAEEELIDSETPVVEHADEAVNTQL